MQYWKNSRGSAQFSQILELGSRGLGEPVDILGGPSTELRLDIGQVGLWQLRWKLLTKSRNLPHLFDTVSWVRAYKTFQRGG